MLGSSNERSVEFTSAFRDRWNCISLGSSIIETSVGSLPESCDFLPSLTARPWLTEDCRMAILDAAAFGLRFFAF